MKYEEALEAMKQGKIVRQNSALYFMRDGKNIEEIVLDAYEEVGSKSKARLRTNSKIDVILLNSSEVDIDSVSKKENWELIG